jgi:uncharacterized phage-associated protein
MAIKTKPSLPPRLEAVMVLLCRGAKLNKTQAVKLPYLVDVLATRHLGRPITEGQHEAWDYGVVTKQAWRHLDQCESGDSVFRLKAVQHSEEKRVELLPAASGLDGRLTAAERAIVNYVRETYGSVPASELGKMTKVMNPEVDRWGGNLRADIGPNAYDRMAPEYQEMAKRTASITDEELRRHSVLVVNLEDAIA